MTTPALDSSSRLAASLADRYRIERELGRGGMATVYLARDLKHDRDVALKVLHPELGESLGRDRFLREIRLAARLNHPHILPLYDSGEANGLLYFVMPVMQGLTLRDRLDQERSLPVDDAIRIATEVADALDYAHRNDVVHRDVKPENILLHESHAVVADFGIGKALVAASEAASNFTQVGVTVGTPAYMSPEQASGENLDGRSDLFALGCVLYEMLTGEVAFSGTTVQAVIAKRFTYTPPHVTDVRPVVPPAVSVTVARLLELEPSNRHTSGAQVVTALRTLDAPVSSGPARADRSLVVLPFTNMSTDAENEIFADGLTEELIADLARVKALRVISRNSSMQLKGTSQGIRAIGRELGVRYALTGSVRKAGSSLRITAQLIDTHRDEQLWADKYNGSVDEVFDLQERVSRAIAEALDVTLSAGDEVRLADRPIASVRAFELYLQARQEVRRYNIGRALPLLQQAIDIEGNVPALRALRAAANLYLVRSGQHTDRSPLDEAEAEGRKLLTEVPAASYGHAILGFAAYESGDLRAAVDHVTAARAIDPNEADLQFYLGVSLIGAGQNAAVATVVRDMSATDPLSSMTPLLAGIATWFVGRPGEGLESTERAAALEPESVIHNWTLGYHYALLGRTADARRQLAWMQKRVPQMAYTIQLGTLLDAMEGRKAEALAELGKLNIALFDGHTRYHLAEGYAMAGDIPRAIELIRDAVETSFYPADFIAHHNPFMAPLKSHPDFERIVEIANQRVREF